MRFFPRLYPFTVVWTCQRLPAHLLLICPSQSPRLLCTALTSHPSCSPCPSHMGSTLRFSNFLCSLFPQDLCTSYCLHLKCSGPPFQFSLAHPPSLSCKAVSLSTFLQTPDESGLQCNLSIRTLILAHALFIWLFNSYLSPDLSILPAGAELVPVLLIILSPEPIAGPGCGEYSINSVWITNKEISWWMDRT